jgi:hypothetical protein
MNRPSASGLYEARIHAYQTMHTHVDEGLNGKWMNSLMRSGYSTMHLKLEVLFYRVQ